MERDKPLEYYALRERKKSLIESQSPEGDVFCEVLKYAILKKSSQEKDYQTKQEQQKTLLTS